ncbi:MAG: ATP-binding cassette domain-containing protein [Candidatus Caldarchaeum sp.]
MTEAIVAEDLVKVFGKLVAVDRVWLSVREGELFGFLGPNGAGKTTTINILTTLLRPTSGRAVVGGYDVVTQAEKVRRVVGLVPQDLTVDDELTGWENLMLQAGLYHIPKHEARKRAAEVLELVGLMDAAKRKVETYSGGMRKRLELAAGLIHNPEILFLDEPTLGLDVQTRAAIWDYIKRLRKELGMTVFLTTHYMDEADFLCDRIAIIDHGKIKALDTPANLKASLGGSIIELEITDGAGHDITTLLNKVEGVEKTVFADGVYRLTVDNGEEKLPTLLETLLKTGVRVSRIVMKKPTLDEVFLEYTGRALRAETGSWEETFKQMRTIRRMRA